MALLTKLREEIIEEQQDWILAHTDLISDFNDGSIVSAIIGAVGVVCEEIYYDIALNWANTMRFALQNTLKFTKKNGGFSAGNVIFGVSVAPITTITILEGTVVANDAGNRYVTSADGQITAGQTSSASIPIVAEVVGSESNTGTGTITTMVTTIVGVETVTNPAPTTGGANAESETAYNNRFADYLKGLVGATIPAMRATANSVVGVSQSEVLEDEDNPGRLTLFVDDGSGSATPTLLASVKTAIEGDDTLDNPGNRPAGIIITYQSALRVDVNITAVLSVAVGSDFDTVIAAAELAISSFINKLRIGENVVVEQIREELRSVAGVVDIELTSPTGNIAIQKALGQVAKVGTLDISAVIYEDTD